MTKLQLAERPDEPERCAAENLKPGQFLASGALTTGRPTEVLFVDTYPANGGRETHIVHRPLGCDWSSSSTAAADRWFDLATEEQLAEFRAGVDRVNFVAGLHEFADWVEANPWAPIKRSSGYLQTARIQIGLHGDDMDAKADAVAKVREIADRLGVKVDESLDDRTGASTTIGSVEYSVIAWHPDGRPAEPEPLRSEFVDGPCVHTDCPNASWPHLASSDLADPDLTGLNYTRADDEPDDPTPVSGARVAPHTGGLTDEGLVDETPAQVPTCVFEVSGRSTLHPQLCDQPILWSAGFGTWHHADGAWRGHDAKPSDQAIDERERERIDAMPQAD